MIYRTSHDDLTMCNYRVVKHHLYAIRGQAETVLFPLHVPTVDYHWPDVTVGIGSKSSFHDLLATWHQISRPGFE